MGYHHAQKRTIPFKMLVKSLEEIKKNSGSDFYLQIQDQIERTCLAIMEDEEFDKKQLSIEESKGLELRQELLKQFEEVLKLDELEIYN